MTIASTSFWSRDLSHIQSPKDAALEFTAIVTRMGMHTLEADTDGHNPDAIVINTLDPKFKDHPFLGTIWRSGRFAQNDNPKAPLLDMTDIMFISWVNVVLLGSRPIFNEVWEILPKVEFDEEILLTTEQIYELALARKLLSKDKTSPHYVGNYMYMGKNEHKGYLFKHYDTKHYITMAASS